MASESSCCALPGLMCFLYIAKYYTQGFIQGGALGYPLPPAIAPGYTNVGDYYNRDEDSDYRLL